MAADAAVSAAGAPATRHRLPPFPVARAAVAAIPAPAAVVPAAMATVTVG